MRRLLIASLGLIALVSTAAADSTAPKACPAPAADGPIEFCGKEWPRDSKIISSCEQRPPDLCPLAGLPQLTELRARPTQSLRGLDRLTRLESLDLRGTKF